MSPDDTPDADGRTAAPDGVNRDDLTTPDDYDAADAWQENGLEQCPHCERSFSHTLSILRQPVYDTTGAEHDSLYDTPADNGPYFCAECWPVLARNRQIQANLSLTEAAGDGTPSTGGER